MPSPPLPAPTIPPSQIHVTDLCLGRGSFGTVHRGFFSGSPVAVKICNLSSQTPPSPTSRSALVQFRRESARYTALHHPCITQFFGVVSHPDSHQLLLVTELMNGGSLYNAISTLRNAGAKRLPLDAILRIALDVTNGMAYLHASSFSFGDLKTMNVLLSAPPDMKRATIPATVKAKLCDFGLSRNLKHLVHSDAPPRPDETVIAARHGPAGTFAYMAPEAFSGLPVDDAEAPKRADIFALGVVLWELATMKKPWPGKQAFQLVKLVGVDGQRLKWAGEHAWLPKGYVSLVEWCWKEDALQRPTVDQVAKVLEELRRSHESAEFEGLSTFEEEDCQVQSSYGATLAENIDNKSVSDDSDVMLVEEEVLRTDEFQNFRLTLAMGSRGGSTETGVGDTELSDVTGELQRTGSHSRLSDHGGDSLVQYVQTEEKTKSMLMLDEVAGLSEEMEAEFDGFGESGDVGYLETGENKKLPTLDGTGAPGNGVDEDFMGHTGDECENETEQGYLQTQQRTKSMELLDGLEGLGEGWEEELEGLNLEDSDDATLNNGLDYLETEESTKSTEMSKGIEKVVDKVEGGMGELMDKAWEERRIESGEEVTTEQLGLSKSTVISQGRVDMVMEAEKKLLRVRRGSKSVGNNIDTGGGLEKRARSRSYIVPRECMLEFEVEMELEELYRLSPKGPDVGTVNEKEGEGEKGGNGEEGAGNIGNKGIGSEGKGMEVAQKQRLYDVKVVDWSRADEELSRWEEEELDVEQSGVNMFSRPHFK